MMDTSIPELPEIRRLVVEAGFAAVHLGLRHELRTILTALPGWIEDPVVLASCQATMLFGLNQPADALAQLDGLPDDVCAELRALLHTQLAAQPGRAA
ncbi:DUF1039 domain-containing protein [Chitinimonas sp. PSY-7]|uniref:DUF1039 domain-containing protein n=1 Tax=Chitinimonas sp. PSY-7 TaxID=3459088 RepID=UPI00403FEE95